MFEKNLELKIVVDDKENLSVEIYEPETGNFMRLKSGESTKAPNLFQAKVAEELFSCLSSLYDDLIEQENFEKTAGITLDMLTEGSKEGVIRLVKDEPFVIEPGHVNAAYELWFDVDKVFGTVTKDNDDRTVSFYTDYYPETGVMKAEVVVQDSDGEVSKEYFLSEKEKNFLLDMMEKEAKAQGYDSFADMYRKEFCSDRCPDISGITLLSKEEYEEYRDNIENINDAWWLRSPYADRRIYAALVIDDGYVFNYSVYNDGAARPALRISDLESAELEIGDKFAFGDRLFTIISDTYALCDESIGKSAFRNDRTAENANDYGKSDIKNFVEEWYEKALEQIQDREQEEIGGER